MAGGYMGKLPWVNLTTGQVETIEPSEDMWRKWIGGYGIGSRLIYERLRPGVDPLGPGNILGMVAGPLAGTPAISSGRYTVMGKSPLTGGWGDANGGGYFGPYMKFAGIDGIFIEGAADKPVYIFVEGDNVEIRDASDLWGLDFLQAENTLLARYGKGTAVAGIGPAGEKLSLISCVLNDGGRAAGRSGVGAIMGSKNLKAVVVRGNLKVPIADPELLRQVVKKLRAEMEANDWYHTAHDYGTPGITADSIVSGDGPLANWGGAYPKDFPDENVLSGDNVIKYQYKRYACWGCPIGCGGWVKVDSGPFAVAKGHKPEYETIGSFGFLCKNENVESLCKANEICNIMGLDTISAGATVAFAIECYENGILTKADTDGLDLRWGNAEAIVGLTQKIALREGIGDVLADGVKVASERIGKGSDQFAIHIGGQELPMHDGKLAPGIALTYQYDATPGRHCQGCEDWPQPNLPVKSYEMTDYSGRGADHMKQAAHMHIENSAGICQFAAAAYDAAGLADQIQAVTGWDYTLDNIFEDGERIHTMRHLFNLREGINPRNIKSPGRAIGVPPLDSGALKGVTVDLEQMVKDFYAHVDWDLDTSMPSQATLDRLGLAELVEKYGK